MLAVLLVMLYDEFDVEHQAAHEEERDDNLEDCDEVEDVVELLRHVVRQRYRVHEVDYHDEDQRGYHEHLYLTVQQMSRTLVPEDQQVINPKYSHIGVSLKGLTIDWKAGRNRSLSSCKGRSPGNQAFLDSANPCR